MSSLKEKVVTYGGITAVGALGAFGLYDKFPALTEMFNAAVANPFGQAALIGLGTLVGGFISGIIGANFFSKNREGLEAFVPMIAGFVGASTVGGFGSYVVTDKAVDYFHKITTDETSMDIRYNDDVTLTLTVDEQPLQTGHHTPRLQVA